MRRKTGKPFGLSGRIHCWQGNWGSEEVSRWRERPYLEWLSWRVNGLKRSKSSDRIQGTFHISVRPRDLQPSCPRWGRAWPPGEHWGLPCCSSSCCSSGCRSSDPSRRSACSSTLGAGTLLQWGGKVGFWRAWLFRSIDLKHISKTNSHESWALSVLWVSCKELK